MYFLKKSRDSLRIIIYLCDDIQNITNPDFVLLLVFCNGDLHTVTASPEFARCHMKKCLHYKILRSIAILAQVTGRPQPVPLSDMVQSDPSRSGECDKAALKTYGTKRQTCLSLKALRRVPTVSCLRVCRHGFLLWTSVFDDHA